MKYCWNFKNVGHLEEKIAFDCPSVTSTREQPSDDLIKQNKLELQFAVLQATRLWHDKKHSAMMIAATQDVMLDADKHQQIDCCD